MLSECVHKYQFSGRFLLGTSPYDPDHLGVTKLGVENP